MVPAELALIAGSSIAGAVSAVLIEKLSKTRASTNYYNNSKKPRQLKPTASTARAELVSLLFEKSLAAEAITRVYEAALQGKIDRLERDRLLVKYKQQLESLNQRIAQLQPVADLADLTELRNELVSLLENKISAIDQRLLELSNKSGITVASSSSLTTASSSSSSTTISLDQKVQKIIEETTKNVQQGAAQVVDQHKSFKAEEKSIEQLQNEIMQALYRLEQVEIDKD